MDGMAVFSNIMDIFALVDHPADNTGEIGMSGSPSSRDLEVFNAVAVDLSFRRAAERLGMDQSALSRRIRSLEDQLGYMLVRRTTREVSLTAAGALLHERTRLIGSEIDAAVRAGRIAAEGKRGLLRIGYMSFAAIEWMPKVVREFTNRYPDVELELKYLRTQGQKIELSRNNIDVGFMLGPFQHPQFEAFSMVVEPLVAILPVQHELASRSEVTFADLARYPLVLGNIAEWDFFRQFVLDAFAQANVAAQVKYEASNAMGILGLVASGLGVSVYAQALEKLQPQGIAIRPIADCRQDLETVLAWNRAYKNPVLMNFVKVARSLVSK
jgi:LysR family transcriptional regulator, benzoate and cis,cis-muconate-responsive activator of ben and cat genes